MNNTNFDSIEHHKISSPMMRLAYEQELQGNRLKKTIIAVTLPIFHLIEATFHAYKAVGESVVALCMVGTIIPFIVPVFPLRGIDAVTGFHLFHYYEIIFKPFTEIIAIVMISVGKFFGFPVEELPLRTLKAASCTRNVFLSLISLYSVSKAIDQCYGKNSASAIKKISKTNIETKEALKKEQTIGEKIILKYDEIKKKIDSLALDQNFDNSIKEFAKDIKIYENEHKTYTDSKKDHRQNMRDPIYCKVSNLQAKNLKILIEAKKYWCNLAKNLAHQELLSQKHTEFNQLKINSPEERKKGRELISEIEVLSSKYIELKCGATEKFIYAVHYQEINEQQKKLVKLEQENRENAKKLNSMPIAKEISVETLFVEIETFTDDVTAAQHNYEKMSKSVDDLGKDKEINEDQYYQLKKEIKEFAPLRTKLDERSSTLLLRVAKRFPLESPETTVKDAAKIVLGLSPQKLLETLDAKLFHQKSLLIAPAIEELKKAHTKAINSIKKIKNNLPGEQRIKEAKAYESAIETELEKCKDAISETEKFAGKSYQNREIIKANRTLLEEYTISPKHLLKLDNFKDLAIELPALNSLRTNLAHLTIPIAKTVIPAAPAGINLAAKFKDLFSEIENGFPESIVLRKNDGDDRVQTVSKSQLTQSLQASLQLLTNGILRDSHNRLASSAMATEAHNCLAHIALTFEERLNNIKEETDPNTKNKLLKACKIDLTTLFMEVGIATFFCMDRQSQTFLRNYIRFVEKKKFDEDNIQTPFKDRILARLLEYRRIALTNAMGDNVHDSSYFENLFNEKFQLNLPKNLNSFREYDACAYKAITSQIETRFWENYSPRAISEHFASLVMNPHTKDIPYGYWIREMGKKDLFTSEQVHAKDKISPEAVSKAILDLGIFEKQSLMGRVQHAGANLVPESKKLREIGITIIQVAGLSVFLGYLFVDIYRTINQHRIGR